MKTQLIKALEKTIKNESNKATRTEQTPPLMQSFSKERAFLQASATCHYPNDIATQAILTANKTFEEPHMHRPSYFSVFPKRVRKFASIREASESIKVISRSNSKLKRSLKDVRHTVNLAKTRIRNEKVVEVKTEEALEKSQVTQSFFNADYIKHNKLSLFNVTSEKCRPSTDYSWLRTMRTPPKNLTTRNWKRKLEFKHKGNNVDIRNLKEDIHVQPSYKYCSKCGHKPQLIRLRKLDEN